MTQRFTLFDALVMLVLLMCFAAGVILASPFLLVYWLLDKVTLKEYEDKYGVGFDK